MYSDYQKHLENHRKHNKAYRDSHREELNAARREYYKTHREQEIERAKQYYRNQMLDYARKAAANG